VDGNTAIISKDINGEYHFNGNFKNGADLAEGLDGLKNTSYSELAAAGAEYVLDVFEEVFNHKAFTGRSGTFYGYEGLGSIYWHMVSKLQLAVLECCLKAIRDGESAEIIGRLLEHYYEINEGIGVHKSPSLYGAFPTDPYSHTPFGKGAQQPGMTGQVKEDILSRFGELGVFVDEGKLYFDPCMLRKDEFLLEDKVFEYVNIASKERQIPVAAGSICFTYCQVPIVYTIAETSTLEVHFEGAKTEKIDGLSLDAETSQKVFNRAGEIVQINVYIKKDHLK
jgi:hypothetical protein